MALRAEAAVVPFAGRDDELHGSNGLVPWLKDQKSLSLYAVHGRAGSGKTRLAAQLIREARENGWTAGFLADVGNVHSVAEMRDILQLGHRALIVLDYAETRPDRIRALIEAARESSENQTIRILLLSRSLGRWWEDLRNGGDMSGRFIKSRATQEMKLKPLCDTIEGRRREFDRAHKSFASLFSIRTEKRLPKSLLKEDFRHVLSVHMAAFLAVFGREAVDEQNALDEVLAHECSYWRSRFPRSFETVPPYQSERLIQLMRIVVALATLFGECSTANLESALSRMGAIAPKNAQMRRRLTLFAAYLYPGERDAVGALSPDLVGEHLVERVIADYGSQVIHAAFSDEGNNLQLAHAAELLFRLFERRPAMEKWALVAADELRKLVDGEPERGLASYIAETLPRSSLALDDFSAHIAAWAARVIAVPADADERTRVLLIVRAQMRAANHFVQIGDLRKAIAISDGLNELLSGREGKLLSPSHRVALLLHHSELAMEGGLHQRALASAEEALRMSESCDGEEGRSAKAHAQYMCAKLYHSFGRAEEAGSLIASAVPTLRELAEGGDSQQNVVLGSALITAGTIRVSLGENGRAKLLLEESEGILNGLVEQSFDRYGREYSHCLLMSGYVAAASGEFEEAAYFESKALSIRRKLAAIRPMAFKPGLALALSNLSHTVALRGDKRRSYDLAQEAVELGRELIQVDRQAHEARYALALQNAVSASIRMECLDQADACGKECLELYNRLANKGQQEFMKGLAMAHSNYATVMMLKGRWDDALHNLGWAEKRLLEVSFERSDLLDRELFKVYATMSSVQAQKEDHEEYIVALTKSLDAARKVIESGDFSLYWDIGVLYEAAGPWLERLERFNDLCKLHNSVIRALLPVWRSAPALYLQGIVNVGATYIKVRREAGSEDDIWLIDELRLLIELGTDIRRLRRYTPIELE